VTRRGFLTSAGIGGAVLAGTPLLGAQTAAASPHDPLRTSVGDPLTTPRVAGLHLQFGADAAREVVVSWHTLTPVGSPRVYYGSSNGVLGTAASAESVSYTDAKSGQVVYAHHARLTQLRPGTRYGYAAVHDGAQPELATFRTAPTGRAKFTFTSFGDQGTPTTGKKNSGGTFVNDNLGSPAAGDTTAGVERVQPLFHLFNGDLCYANIATDRVRTWSDFWGEQHPQRAAPALDAIGWATTRTNSVTDPSGSLRTRPTSAYPAPTARRTPPAVCGTRSPSARCGSSA